LSEINIKFIEGLPDLYRRVADLELHNSLEGYKPRFTIADRDAKIKGLEAELQAQRAHYQGELEKARKAIDALSSEHIREHSRRVELEDEMTKVRAEREALRKELTWSMKIVVLPEDDSDFYIPQDEDGEVGN
jgi:predicted  nucleic acid-binding Zn-ribbon protein